MDMNSDPTTWAPGDVIMKRSDGRLVVLKERKTEANDPGGAAWPGWWIFGGGGLADRVAIERWVRLTGRRDISSIVRSVSGHDQPTPQVITKLLQELEEEMELADRLATELSRWGWGDMHYSSEVKQEACVADLVAEHARRRTPPDPTETPVN